MELKNIMVISKTEINVDKYISCHNGSEEELSFKMDDNKHILFTASLSSGKTAFFLGR